MYVNSRPVDALGRFVQAGPACGVRLVRLVELDENNRYTANPLEFDADGDVQVDTDVTLVVTNIAEPADQDGQLDADTDAVAVDVDGCWIICVRQGGSAMFPAKVVSSSGGAVYSVREQKISAAGVFSDADDTTNVTARNLAELSLGPGAAVDNDTIVLVTTLSSAGSPPTLMYVFDHPTYAKYLS